MQRRQQTYEEMARVEDEKVRQGKEAEGYVRVPGDVAGMEHVLMVRFTSSELARVEKAAKSEGKNAAEYVREAAMQASRRRPARRPVSDAGFAELARYQLDVAETWEKKASELFDPFAKFFFLFSGLNSIYSLWARADALPGIPEDEHIRHLIRQFGDQTAERCLSSLPLGVAYFGHQVTLLQMDKWNGDNRGDEEEDRHYREQLQDTALPGTERLAALASILYIVRCNLVHGSKRQQGTDERIVEQAVGPLEVLLAEALPLTRNRFLSKQTRQDEREG